MTENQLFLFYWSCSSLLWSRSWILAISKTWKNTSKQGKFVWLTYQFSILSPTANLRDVISKNWQNIAMFYSVHMQIFIYIFQFLLTSQCIFYYSTTADIFQCDFPVLIKHCFVWLFISREVILDPRSKNTSSERCRRFACFYVKVFHWP